MKKVLFVFLFLLFSYSWSACTSGFWTTYPSGAHVFPCRTAGCAVNEWGDRPYCSEIAACTGEGCPSSYVSGSISYFSPTFSTSPACNPSANFCNGTSVVGGCYYAVRCEGDTTGVGELICEIDPSADGCAPACDSTHWECTTSVEHNQTTIANDNVQCFDGDCYGGVYCEYTSKSITDCRNDCGQFTTQSASTAPIRYEGRCNEDNLTDDTECTQVKCMSFEKTQSYTLYKLCASREIINGERQFLPRIVGGGKGNCKNAGYPESNPDDLGGSSSSSDSLSVPESCFTMGIGCPASDSSSYEDAENRTPDKCNCEKYDGISTISQIVCPDGSRSIFYGSCHDWENPPSSSSNVPPESSSSGSENPLSSSGGEYRQDWVNWSQGEEIKGLLSVIALNTAKEQSIDNVNSVNIALDDYTTTINDSAPALVVPDSMYQPEYFIDTLGLADSIFKRVTEENTILDTLLSSGASCPCLTFFASNGGQSSTANGHIKIQQIQFDFANFHGYNLCHIISVIVTGLASVVAFFIGFAIFKNVSQ